MESSTISIMSGSPVPGGGRAGLLTADARHPRLPPGYRCQVELIQLTPQLHFIQFPVGHAYLWHDPDGLTLIDTGLPGSAPLIAVAIHQAGYEPADLRHLVLTHFHPDHIGAAADIAGWGEVEVLAHHADVPFIRAQAAGPPPDLADWERPLYEQVTSQATSHVTSPAAPERPTPPRIERELSDGDELGFGDGAVAVAVPGHTPGSVAIYLPRHQVLFTGDAAARTPDGTVICGVFNVDRAQAAASFRRLAGLDVAVACFGHGEPLTDDAAAALLSAAERLPAGAGNGHPDS
jgi:glyoxylase-like metal-dependent hydrolase (beta-lactamase superfamily II)